MKTRFLAVALSLALAPALFVFPQTASAQDVEALMREMHGEATAPARDAAAWQAAYTQVLASLLPAMSDADLGKRGAAQNSWEKIVLRASRPNAEAERAGVSRAMLAQVGAGTPLEARLWLLKMLEWSGRAEAVPTLAGLLNDADAQVAERARRALANNSAPEAGAALLSALGNATAPEKKVVLINALGFRREAGAVPVLRKALGDASEPVATEAIRALSRMARPDAAQALLALALKAGGAQAKWAPVLTVELIDAAARVRSADPKVAAQIFEAVYDSGPPALKAGALRGLVQVRGAAALPLVIAALKNPASAASAARLTLLMPGANAAKALAKALPTLPASAQVLVLPALAERGAADRDASLNTALVSLLNAAATPVEVKAEAARTLGELGAVGDTALLLKMAVLETDDGKGARSALGRLGVAARDGAAVEARLLAAAAGTDAVARREAVRALSARRTAGALPTFTKLMDDTDKDVRAEALRALGENGGAAQVPVIVAWMSKTGDAGAADRALQTIFGRTDRATIAPAPFLQVLDGANVAANVRATSYKMLGLLGSREGFERLRAASTNDNEDVRDAGIRALADWPGGEALPVLMDLARTAAKPVHQVLALRGVARLAPVTGDNAQKVATLLDALGIAKRGEEKQLMLAALGSVKSVEAARAVEPLLADEGLREAAASAIFQISRELRDDNFRTVKPLVQKALEVAQNNDLKRDLKAQADRNG
jgi:HEAT repeat protein